MTLVDHWSRPAWRNFSEAEMRCKCGCGALPDPLMMGHLQQLRDQLGFALPVTSGARCPDYNAQVSTTGRDGPHTTGLAVDIGVDRARAWALLREAFHGPWTGIGVKQHGSEGRFIHLDMMVAAGHPRPTIWSYP